jgi:hypothetical protein
MSEAAVIRNFLQPYADRIGHRYMKTSWLSSIALSVENGEQQVDGAHSFWWRPSGP